MFVQVKLPCCLLVLECCLHEHSGISERRLVEEDLHIGGAVLIGYCLRKNRRFGRVRDDELGDQLRATHRVTGIGHAEQQMQVVLFVDRMRIVPGERTVGDRDQ